MKYKVGDKARVKDDFLGPLNAMYCLEKLPSRIVTVKKVHNYYYEMEEIRWGWREDVLEDCAEEQKKIFEPIQSRFDILDIRGV